MALFEICYEWVLPHEAGTPPRYNITADPVSPLPNPDNDPAIAADNDRRRLAQACAGINSYWYRLDFAFIAALAEADRPAAVAAFYQRKFWSPQLAQIASNAVASYLLDSEVNQGQGKGVKILQTALGACGQPVKPDGCLGPASLTAVNLIPPAALKGPFQNARIVAYNRIGGPNLSGWLKRAKLWPPFD